MSKLLSFLGGAAKGFIEEVDKSEKYGRETALAQMKQLAENYEKTREENTKLTNELKGVEQWTKTVYGNDATPEQIAFLQGNPVAFQALKSLDNPTKFRLNDIISIVSGNESKAVGAQRVAELPALTEKVSTALQSKGFFAREFEAAETRAASTAERQFERAYGTSAETMRAALPVQRPSVEGTFDMATILEKTPSSMDEIIKTGEVARFQAGRKFGKDSQEYKDADAMVKEAESEIVKADKKLEDRRDRLEIERNDNKGDPILVAALTKEINGINADIKARREATSTKSERAGTGGSADAITYAKAKSRLDDYSNTDLNMSRGLGWRKHVVDKVVKDPATGENITIPGKKVGLSPEEEKEFIEGMAQTRMQGLKDLGLVTEKGQPINNEVKSLMISYGLMRPTQTPSPAPAQNQQQQSAPLAAANTPAPPSVDIKKERALAEAAIKAQPQNAEAIKANFKVRTKTDY
jgi:hypothetical protein